jgi:hypothetical protein
MGWDFTVWQKLEEQNPEFFKAYYTRLKLKKQIMLFNHLLEQQVQLMHKMRLFPVQAPLLQNGMHLTPKTSTITMPVSCSIQLAWVCVISSLEASDCVSFLSSPSIFCCTCDI